MLSRWLAAPHVTQWWPGASGGDAVEQRFGPRVDGTEPTEVFLVEVDKKPVGFVQRYRQSDYPEWDRAARVDNAIGIDYLIGEVEYIGAGIASEAIRQATGQAFWDYPDVGAVCAVPQQANIGSWRALEKAGFSRAQAIDHVESDDPSDEGPAFVYVFERRALGSADAWPRSDMVELRDQLNRQLEDALALIGDLEEDLSAIAESTAERPDDEHDAEGATVGFERARVSALLERTRRTADELSAALGRLAKGDFGRCEVCGSRIPPERLGALPTTCRCMDCASARMSLGGRPRPLR
jgi:aminoglycoside 6'-N-acetyltransferase